MNHQFRSVGEFRADARKGGYKKALNIVFISEERGSGTTANMHAVAQSCYDLQKKERERGRPKWQQTKLRFIDCSAVSTEERKFYCKRADIIVVNLRQSDKSFQSYFMKKQKYQDKSMYLISRYRKDSIWNREVIQRRYRMAKEQLCVIPQNNAYAFAYAKGRQQQFLQKIKEKKTQTLEEQEFTREVEQTARQLLRLLEDRVENSLFNFSDERANIFA